MISRTSPGNVARGASVGVDVRRFLGFAGAAVWLIGIVIEMFLRCANITLGNKQLSWGLLVASTCTAAGAMAVFVGNFCDD